PIEYLPSLRPAASGAKTPSLRTDPHSNRSVNMPATPRGFPRTRAGALDPGGIGARIGPGQGRCEAARWNPAGLQQRSGPAETGSRFCRGAPLERDDFSSNRHPALAFWWSMISGVPPESETRIIGTVLEERTDAQTEITCFQPCIQVGGGAADD